MPAEIFVTFDISGEEGQKLPVIASQGSRSVYSFNFLAWEKESLLMRITVDFKTGEQSSNPLDLGILELHIDK